MTRFSFHLWHLFFAVGVVGVGLWAWSLTGMGGLSLVIAWACGAVSVMAKDQLQEPASDRKVAKSVYLLDLGLVVLLGYWVLFHFSAA